MMEECSKGSGAACSPKLLDLIPKEMEWAVAKGKNGDVERSSVEIRKLELRLGLPGDDEWSLKNTNTAKNMNRERDHHDSLFSLGYFNHGHHHNHHHHFHHHQPSHKAGSHEMSPQVGPVAGSSSSSVWFNQQQQQLAPPSSFLQFPTTTKAATDKQQSSCLLLPTVAKESSQLCCTKVGAIDLQQGPAEKKAFSPPAAPPTPANTAVANSSQKRTAPGPVVGWPPIRSFRKNLASSSSSSKQQQTTDSQSGNPNKKAATSDKPVEVCKKGMFVKINMDGVPIGRKVDLTAYDSYPRLSTAVDELFRGLLAAQRDSSAGGNINKQQQEGEEKAITGLLDGSGEYTLVYEDNEGDRMLVGDVPWHMFVSTVKRLRVLKSSEVSALSLGCSKQEKMVAMK